MAQVEELVTRLRAQTVDEKTNPVDQPEDVLPGHSGEPEIEHSMVDVLELQIPPIKLVRE